MYWRTITSFEGSSIWTDGNNIYCDTGTTSHGILKKETNSMKYPSCKPNFN